MADKLKEGTEVDRNRFYIPRRYILCFLVSTGFLIMNCQRSCLSVAIVAMSSRTRHWESEKWVSKPAEFDWDSEKKGLLLGAFFYGYLVLQIPGGWLCMKLGGKIVFGFAIFGSSLVNAMLPQIVRMNEDLFFAARIIQGLLLGVTLPTNHFLWSKWAPSKEKGTLISFSVAGLSAGMLTAYPISGLLCQYGFSGGWPSVFYSFGGLGIVWAIAWYLLINDTPLTHPSISKEELSKMDQIEAVAAKQEKIPWSKIFTSLPVYGVIAANFAFDSCYYTLLITMPLFLRDVHKFNVATTGITAALPWLFMTIITPTAGFFSDQLHNRLSVGVTRKLFFCVGVIGSGTFLVISGYIASSTGTIAIMCVAVAFFGFAFSGFMVNPMDIAPKYAGTIIGISNTLATTPGFIGPALVGIITKHGTNQEWIEVFYYLAGVSILGGGLFCILGSGHIQSWAVYDILEEDTIEMGENAENEESKNKLDMLETVKGETNVDKARDTG